MAKSPPRGYGPHLQFETRDPLWHPTTADEIKAYIGINIAMGIKNLPGYKDYRSTEPLLHDAFISGILTRTRNSASTSTVLCQGMKTGTISWRRSALCEQNFGQCYQPSRDVSIDEAMVQFDGRLCWMQYMPKKPVKWGIKLWCHCDSTTGFCAKFSVYCGRDDDDQDASLDLGYKVVMRLMRDRLQRHHHVYADNYFTSVHLAEALLRSGTYLCGTTRSTRRDFPKGVVGVRLAAGESFNFPHDGASRHFSTGAGNCMFLYNYNFSVEMKHGSFLGSNCCEGAERKCLCKLSRQLPGGSSPHRNAVPVGQCEKRCRANFRRPR